jgi:primosomal protein N' (replication factor Y) (superfamily II helicase)
MKPAASFCHVLILKESRALADRTFTYEVPLHETFEAGQLVRVPFGHQGMVPALIMAMDVQPPKGYTCKPLGQAISPGRFFTDVQLALLHEMARATLTPLAQVALAALPSSFLQLTPGQFAFPLQWMVTLQPEQSECDKKHALTKRQGEVTSALLKLREETGEVQWPLKELMQHLHCTRDVLRKLETAGFVVLHQEPRPRCSLALFEDVAHAHRHPLCLNAIQQQVFQAILQTCKRPYTAETHQMLLHGVTGSGKTELYMAIAQEQMAQGKSVLLLLPEIALTGALAERFVKRFGRRRLAMWHSQLSKGEKLDTWQRIASGEVRLVLGARSALFVPLHQPGFIILDECHDGSFKQDTPAPRYNAVTMARWMSERFHVPLLMGSATPETALLHEALATKTLQYFELAQRYGTATLPRVQVVDMKEERAHGHMHALSRSLQHALQETMAREEQAIIMLNRRGFHTFISCGSCGHVFECPACSVSVTYHKAFQQVKCHHCGFTAERPQYCPTCGSLRVQFVGQGTQKLEVELAKLLGESVPIFRLDGDIMQRKGAFREVLGQFRQHKGSVLVGTQLVAKGLDVPNCTLVGVLGADAAFYQPDYLAHERGFQLLTQVAGRAGRGEKPGRVIMQAWQPDHPVLHLAIVQDAIAFYHLEIGERQMHHYPPFCQLIRLLVTGEDLERVHFFAKALASHLKGHFQEQGWPAGEGHYQLLGPSPCLIERIQGKFRYHLLLKNTGGSRLHQVLGEYLKHLHVPEGLHCLVDPDTKQFM